ASPQTPCTAACAARESPGSAATPPAPKPADTKPSQGPQRPEGAGTGPQTPSTAATAARSSPGSAATPPPRSAAEDAAASAQAFAHASALASALAAGRRRIEGAPAGGGADTGDFVATSAWRCDDAFGVEAGDVVYVSEVESRGWVYARGLRCGRSGWMPRSHCQRHTWRAVEPFSPDPASASSRDLLALEPGDLVWVLDRQPSGWVYGEKRLFDLFICSAAPAKGWFPSWALSGS
ncbi:unnamed protein product, partial [Prorocentrum cordatum]